MDRAYQSGASESAPTEPSNPSIGYPTAGNPGTGTSATKPGAYWYHMIMEELMAVIVAAGITPASGVLNQLLQALRSAGVFVTQAFTDQSTKVATTAWVYGAMATVMTYFGFSVSLTANGYIKFPSILGGLIIQWGSGVSSGTGAGNLVVAFPIAFPSSAFVCLTQSQAANATVTNLSLSPTGASFTTYTASSGAIQSLVNALYIAIGK